MADTACMGSAKERCASWKKLTWGGATSGMMTNGMGPNPKANDLEDNMSCAG
jgi:hypothetical protein